MYQFEGELVARYDAATNSLVDGRWSVTEGAVAAPAISPDEPVPLFPPGTGRRNRHLDGPMVELLTASRLAGRLGSLRLYSGG